jgi:hypothetical protein
MEMKRMIYLESLADLLSRPAPPGREAIVLDEGPVYFLARLRVYGADEVGRAGFAAWWPGAVARWASVLHLLVWLDAPDSVLAGRIRARSQRHRTQVLPEAEVGAFLAGYRTEYTALLEELTRQGPVDVISARTDQEPVESIARRVEVAVTRPAEAVR